MLNLYEIRYLYTSFGFEVMLVCAENISEAEKIVNVDKPYSIRQCYMDTAEFIVGYSIRYPEPDDDEQ